MIGFRLTGMEYQALKTQFRRHGASSVSDLARLAIQQVINPSAGPSNEVTVKLREFDTRLHALGALVPLVAGAGASVDMRIPSLRPLRPVRLCVKP